MYYYCFVSSLLCLCARGQHMLFACCAPRLQVLLLGLWKWNSSRAYWVTQMTLLFVIYYFRFSF